jgi:hypothetical protein
MLSVILSGQTYKTLGAPITPAQSGTTMHSITTQVTQPDQPYFMLLIFRLRYRAVPKVRT